MGDGGGGNPINRVGDAVSAAVTSVAQNVAEPAANTITLGGYNAVTGRSSGYGLDVVNAVTLGTPNWIAESLPKPDMPANPSMPSQPSQARDTVASPNMELAQRNAMTAGGTIFSTPTTWNQSNMRGYNSYGAKTLLGI